ncbi:MAG: hypothetical protein GWN00_01275 [Aliifodinibius sp.]|nr:hypothetical protein [Fodinibius sp.]NIY23493.1 hypothetical protein [Fodinibius sp.]
MVSKGYLTRTQRGTYSVSFDEIPEWINLEHFNAVMNMALPYNQKLYLIAVVKHIKKGFDYCFPKVETLANIVGASIRTCRRLGKVLVEGGILSRECLKGFWVFKPKYDTRITPHLPTVTPHLATVTTHLTPSKKREKEKPKERKAGKVFPAVKKDYTVAAMKLEDVLKNVGKKRTQATDQAPTTKNLAKLWRNTLPLIAMDNIITVNITKKEYGQLTNFRKIVEAQQDCPLKVLEYALYHWEDVTDYIRESVGLKILPEKPVIGFCSKYSMYIYQRYKDSNTPNPSSVVEVEVGSPAKQDQSSQTSLEDLLSKYT